MSDSPGGSSTSTASSGNNDFKRVKQGKIGPFLELDLPFSENEDDRQEEELSKIDDSLRLGREKAKASKESLNTIRVNLLKGGGASKRNGGGARPAMLAAIAGTASVSGGGAAKAPDAPVAEFIFDKAATEELIDKVISEAAAGSSVSSIAVGSNSSSRSNAKSTTDALKPKAAVVKKSATNRKL